MKFWKILLHLDVRHNVRASISFTRAIMSAFQYHLFKHLIRETIIVCVLVMEYSIPWESSQVVFSLKNHFFFEFWCAPERAQPIQIFKNPFFDWCRWDYHFKLLFSHENWKYSKYHMLEWFMVDEDLIFGYVSRWKNSQLF